MVVNLFTVNSEEWSRHFLILDKYQVKVVVIS
jgi:hypothetical protein